MEQNKDNDRDAANRQNDTSNKSTHSSGKDEFDMDLDDDSVDTVEPREEE